MVKRMKRMVSIILALCLVAGALPLTGTAAFTDISDPEVAVAAAVLESMGIVTGMSAGSFNPNEKLTRAQFCTLAVRAMGMDDKASSHSYKMLFTDVKPGSWYTGYVNLAYSESVVNGYGNGKFGPEDGITYGQAATLVLRMLGYTTADIGNVWPVDYTNFANGLGLADGLSLGPYDSVTRGQAAILLYSTLKEPVSGGTSPYYMTFEGVASSETVIVLDNSASSGGSSGLLMACSIGASSASIEYFSQKNTVSDTLEGYLGTLLLNSAGKALGFIPDSKGFEDVTVSSASASTITSSSGSSYRISSGSTVIYNGSLYDYSTSGYIQIDAQSGKNVRLYYDDNDAIKYVYITSGTAASGSDVAVAETSSAGSELARKLGISSAGYSITKNGAPAPASALGQYDVGYYDRTSKTLRVSDYKLTGYISAAFPNLAAAETITVYGCELRVLESAWNTLGSFKLGDKVTLLLTDDCKVAAAYSSGVSADMAGVLSANGGSVTLLGSGLVISAEEISAASLRGGVVKVAASSATKLSCSSPGSVSANVDISKNTVGSYGIAPACEIYEWTGSGYAYSLSGVQGTYSRDFSDIEWTDSLSSSYVSWYRINSAGQVDALLLKDVTGNCYSYGKIKVYADNEGINLGTVTLPAYNTAATVTNSSGESVKYICNGAKGGYGGLVPANHNESYLKASEVTLTKAGTLGSDKFFQSGDVWYAAIAGYEIPVSAEVEVYFDKADSWLSGEAALTSALSSGLTLTLYYDRTPATGAQIRVITVS